MKKAECILLCLTFALTVLYPAGFITAECLGYSFEIISISAFAVTVALLSVCTVLLNCVYKSTPENKAVKILSAVMTTFSLINALLCILGCSEILVIVSALISVGCSVFLTVKHGKPLTLKIAALVLSALMVFPSIFLVYIASVFGVIAQNTVIQTIESPSGKYCAQVIDSDQGALGGSTFVDVCEKSGISLFVFKIEKKPERIYVGGYKEFENMQIYWKDGKCLIINSKECEIE